MAFNFGQIRKNNTTEYLNIISVNLQEEQTKSTEGTTTFIDKVFHTPLSSSKGYFLRMKIYKQNTTQKIYIKIKDSSCEQVVGKVEVPAGNENDYCLFEKIFMPSRDCNQVKIELERESVDYQTGRVVNLEILTFAEVKNLIPYRLKRIGVQGTPGLMMCINGEQIQIGKSGIFEINIDYIITYFGVAIEKDSDKFFLLDYQY